MPTEPRTRNPRGTLTRDRIIQMAVEMADRGGVAALTVRSIASQLGVQPMSLYNHVSNKDDLLDGVIDHVFAEIEVPDNDVDWATAMTTRAHSARSVLGRHPWAITIIETRSTPGPATLRHHNAVLGLLAKAGLSLQMAGHIFAALDSYTYRFVLQEISLPYTDANQTDDPPEVLQGFVANDYPYLADFVKGHLATPGYSFKTEFEFGLNLLIDALRKVA